MICDYLPPQMEQFISLKVLFMILILISRLYFGKEPNLDKIGEIGHQILLIEVITHLKLVLRIKI